MARFLAARRAASYSWATAHRDPPMEARSLPAALAAPRETARATAVPLSIVGILFAATSIVVGVIWDISWHMTIGRDTFWTPAHLAIYLGGLVGGLGSALVVLKTTFRGTPDERARAVRFWGFRGPLGAWAAILGAGMMLTSAPFDDWWHNAYGLDVRIISPPHMVLALGFFGIEIGTIMLMLAFMNRASGAERRALERLLLYVTRSAPSVDSRGER